MDKKFIQASNIPLRFLSQKIALVHKEDFLMVKNVVVEFLDKHIFIFTLDTFTKSALYQTHYKI